MISGFQLLTFVWSTLALVVVIVFPVDDWRATVGVLMLGQAFCAALVRKRLKETASSPLPDFLTIMLLMQLFSKTLTALGLAVSGNAGSAGRVGDVLAAREIVPLQYQFQAEVVFLSAAVVFTFVWILLEGRRPLCIQGEPPPRVLFGTYGVSLGSYLALHTLGLSASLGMGVELLRLFSIGAVAVLLGGGSIFALGRKKSWVALAALLPLYVIALQTGMKAEAALVSLPILLPIVRKITIARVALLGCCVMVIVLFLFPFTQEWRVLNWEHAGGSATEKATIADVAERVFELWDKEGVLETASDGAAKWLTRGASAEQGGLVMLIAERDGFIGPVLIEGLATIFVPRFLWPDKPLYMPGAWFTWYLGNADSPETATSATAMMLPTELYWMFGVPGVVIGMGLLGWIYFSSSRFLIKKAEFGIVPLVGYFAFLSRASGLQEIHTIYAVSSPLIFIVYVVAFDRIQRVFFRPRSAGTR
ncbi:hypothetical protein [Zoogloea sp.]|uniref:hypothetical protein n=1 Tax=Zoogloea sp. TaxID=49181 RepID=UPI0025E093C7|nr:hypothetical protein [Zoogloea sp.]MCK6395843.1 hypothetical protein [Zoogloea sp.]